MKKLILPLTYEDINSHFENSDLDSKMMEFVSPLIDSEEELSVIVSGINNAGKLAFILGNPGVGKSTFLHTLNWRQHIPIRKIIDIDATTFTLEGELNFLYAEVQRIALEEKPKADAGICTIVINYLEYIDDFSEESVKAFFRKLNGLLRNNPILILWPVIAQEDVNKMLEYSKHVSGTLYQRDQSVLKIEGPKPEEYVDITKRTIKVLNEGKELSEFNLTHEDLVETFKEFDELPAIEKNLREYYSRVNSKWESNNNYIEELKLKIPKPTEVWFVFPFQNAESIVNQFARKGNRIEDSWTAVSDKFSDYIVNNQQRAAKWNATRLNLALHGAIKTRVLYCPTNLVVTIAAAFGNNAGLTKVLSNHNLPSHWNKKYPTKTSLKKSPIYKQLIGEPFPSGKRKGGPVLTALKTADPIYKDLVKWISTGSGSDTHLNKAFGEALKDVGMKGVKVEEEHPWIKGIFPDLQIDLGHKIISIEFHYTYQDEPHVVADYVLKKLDTYINQLEFMVK